MKKLFFMAIMLSGMVFASCGGSTQSNSTQECKQEVATFKLGTGINLSHWLSQNQDFKETRASKVGKQDIECIANMGFEHVRIPIDEVQFYPYADSLVRDQEAFDLLKMAIDACLEKNMNVIVDLHIIRSHHFNNENPEANNLFDNLDAQKRHVEIWKDLQKFLKDYPNDKVAYELLNEAVAPTHDKLNQLEATLISEIRKTEPERFILVGSNWCQSIYTMKYMSVPQDDKHLILTFHYYNPFLLTHLGAGWTNLKDLKEQKINYPGKLIEDSSLVMKLDEENAKNILSQNEVWNKERIENDMLDAIKLADSLKLQLYCGEFGVFPDYINKEVRLQWYKDICEIFKKHNIANAHWCYRADFPVVDENRNPNEIPAILIGK